MPVKTIIRTPEEAKAHKKAQRQKSEQATSTKWVCLSPECDVRSRNELCRKFHLRLAHPELAAELFGPPMVTTKKPRVEGKSA